MMFLMKKIVFIFMFALISFFAFAEESELQANLTVKPFVENLSIPSAIVYDAEGFAYISEWWWKKVYKYAPDGTEVFTYDIDGDPSGICFDDEGNLYVSSSSQGSIHRFEKGNPKKQSVYVKGFDIPCGITWIDGALFVVDRGAGKIIRIDGADKTRTLVLENLPQPACIQKVGEVFIISCVSGPIYKMETLDSVPEILCPEISGTGINIVPDGDGFFVCVISEGTVERISLDGQRTVLAEGFSVPIGIAKTPDGKLLFAAWGNNAVFVMDYEFVDAENGFAIPDDYFKGYFENNSDSYVVVRTEDDIPIGNGADSCHNVILAPGDRYNGGIDGCMDYDGNFYKVTARAPHTVSARIDSDGTFHIANGKSYFVNWGGDSIKRFEKWKTWWNEFWWHLRFPQEEKYLLSGVYEKDSEGKNKKRYDFLRKNWGESIIENFGMSQVEWKEKYDLQPQEIKDRITRIGNS